MSEMIKRVAKALELVMIERANKFGTSRDASTALAIAAISAMREPTVEMVRAGRIELGKDNDGGIVYLQSGEVVEVWQPMIDEALK